MAYKKPAVIQHNNIMYTLKTLRTAPWYVQNS